VKLEWEDLPRKIYISMHTSDSIRGILSRRHFVDGTCLAEHHSTARHTSQHTGTRSNTDQDTGNTCVYATARQVRIKHLELQQYTMCSHVTYIVQTLLRYHRDTLYSYNAVTSYPLSFKYIAVHSLIMSWNAETCRSKYSIYCVLRTVLCRCSLCNWK